MNGKFLFYNWALLDGVTVTADESAVGDKVVANLLDPDPDRTFQTAATEVTITFTLPTPRQVGAWAVMAAPNLSPSADVTVEFLLSSVSQYSDTVDAQRPLYSAFELAPYQHAPYGYAEGDEIDVLPPNTSRALDAGYLLDEVQVTISDINGVHLSHILFGPVFEPEINFEFGSNARFLVDAEVENAPSGTTFVLYDPTKRIAPIQWSWLTDAEAAQLNNQLIYVTRKQSPIYAWLYPDLGQVKESQNEFLAYIVGADGPTQIGTDINSATISLSEVRY